MKKYYSLVGSKDSDVTDLYIYGDITSWEWFESDVSSYGIVQELEAVNTSKLRVFINSYGGEVAEGMAIYNALKRFDGVVETYCDGFACSAASLVFMAGKERIAHETSLLMIHNAWSYASGNAKELRKSAEDLEKISGVAANAYRAVMTISDEELNALLDNETWITPTEALQYGFATSIVSSVQMTAASMNARKAVFAKMTKRENPKTSADLEVRLEVRSAEEKPKENKLKQMLAKL